MVARQAGLDTSVQQLSADRDTLSKRRQELSKLLRRLFEEHAAELFTDENYATFAEEYQEEQADILRKLSAIDLSLKQQTDYQSNAEKLRDIIRDYLHIDELTPYILNKLIERIEVGHLEIVDGQRQQKITIVWRFCGGIE